MMKILGFDVPPVPETTPEENTDAEEKLLEDPESVEALPEGDVEAAENKSEAKNQTEEISTDSVDSVKDAEERVEGEQKVLQDPGRRKFIKFASGIAAGVALESAFPTELFAERTPEKYIRSIGIGQLEKPDLGQLEKLGIRPRSIKYAFNNADKLMGSIIENKEEFDRLIKELVKLHADIEIVHAIVCVESAWKQRAIGDISLFKDKLKSAGWSKERIAGYLETVSATDLRAKMRSFGLQDNPSLGLMQIRPESAAEVGYTNTDKLLDDPVYNLLAGSTYFMKMYNKYSQDDLFEAMRRYNQGPGYDNTRRRSKNTIRDSQNLAEYYKAKVSAHLYYHYHRKELNTLK
jgi:hypothetical protein